MGRECHLSAMRRVACSGSRSSYASCRAWTPWHDELLRKVHTKEASMRLIYGVALIALLLGVPIPALAESTPAASSPTAARGGFTGLVDIGDGRRLYLECAGQGSPTVVLESGFRTRADLWSDDLIQPEAPRTMVFPGVAAFTHVCAYDRPGTATVIEGELLPSRSDPVAMPRTAAESVDDLHALLEAADVSGPYVLVGHSYGGMLMRLYASTY